MHRLFVARTEIGHFPDCLPLSIFQQNDLCERLLLDCVMLLQPWLTVEKARGWPEQR